MDNCLCTDPFERVPSLVFILQFFPESGFCWGGSSLVCFSDYSSEHRGHMGIVQNQSGAEEVIAWPMRVD